MLTAVKNHLDWNQKPYQSDSTKEIEEGEIALKRDLKSSFDSVITPANLLSVSYEEVSSLTQLTALFSNSLKEYTNELENLRKIFADNYFSNQKFKLYVILGRDGVHYLREENRGLDFDLFFDKSGQISCYKRIKSTLKKISKLCGVIFSTTHEKVWILKECDDFLKKEYVYEDVTVLNFVCALSKEGKIRKILYVNYLKGEGCDCELISKEGIKVMMHASIFRKFSCMEEKLSNTSKKQVIHFDKYSTATIRAFAESLYLEPEVFKEKYLHKNVFPIFELLAFADEYKQISLYGNCIDIILESARVQDAESVFKANQSCKNYYLTLLYNRLIEQRDKT
jgi:hypothetical protein